MSLDATIWAWKVRGIGASAKLVLLSMADRANEDNICYPSIDRLHLDTELNRKTIIKALQELVDLGLIFDTGARTGETNSVKHYRLNGVKNRHESSPNNGTTKHVSSTDFTRKQSQYYPEAVPILPGSSTDFTRKQSQNWYSEPINEPTKEPIKELSKEPCIAREEKRHSLIDQVSAWYSEKCFTEDIQGHLDYFVSRIANYTHIPRDLPGHFRKAIEEDWAGLRKAPDPDWATLPPPGSDLVRFIVQHDFPSRLRHLDTEEQCRQELKKLIAQRLIEHRLNAA